MKIHRGGSMWKFQPFASCSYSFDFTDEEVPCLFHRLMQKWLLGFRWSRK